MRTPFAIRRQIQLAINWYGTSFTFHRPKLDEYNEPSGEDSIEFIEGIYHASSHEFVELINQEGISIKSKINKGVLCNHNSSNTDVLQQGDSTMIEGITYKITAIEPVMYNDQVIAYEISLEEFVEGAESL